MSARTASHGSDARGSVVVDSVIRASWNVLLPALVAGLALRYLFPTPAEAAGTPFEWLARIAEEHPVALGVGFFIAGTLVARHWCSWVIGPDPDTRPTTVDVRRWIAVAVGAGAILGGRAFVGIYRVESASMLPTLEPLDVVAGSRLGYGLSMRAQANARVPARGELIVFHKPPGTEGPDLIVKRVVGLPGDRISMQGSVVVVNDRPVRYCEVGPYLYPLSDGGGVAGRVFVEFLGDRPHLALYTPGIDPWGGRYEVKPGEVFVLGDNRSNSNDSRAWGGGKGAGLPLRSVEARVQRWLLGVGRDERVDVDHLFQTLELHPRLAGLDTSFIRDGIRNCLAHPPAEAHPMDAHGR
jgi:signal peptidase I